MANVTDAFKDIFLAGVGALAIGAEKTQEVLDQLVEKGQITVDQGKEIANDLKDQAITNTAQMRDDIIAAQMRTMTKEQRDAFAARVAEIAATVDGNAVMMDQEEAEVKAAEAARSGNVE